MHLSRTVHARSSCHERMTDLATLASIVASIVASVASTVASIVASIVASSVASSVASVVRTHTTSDPAASWAATNGLCALPVRCGSGHSGGVFIVASLS